MKKPQIDLYFTIVELYAQQLGWVNRFLAYWSTETLDGVEVLVEKHTYYPMSNEKLMKMLGVYQKVQGQSFKGISSAWVYLNASKYKGLDLIAGAVANKVEPALNGGTELHIGIAPIVTKSYDRDDYEVLTTNDPYHLFDGTNTDAQLVTIIKNNYADILNEYTVIANEDDSLLNLISLYALKGSDLYTISIADVKKSYTGTRVSVLQKALAITISIQGTGTLQDTDPLVTNIVDSYNTALAKKELAAHEQVAQSETYRSFFKVDNTYTDDYLWYKNRLRASAFDRNTGIKTKDLITLIQKSLDTGYTKKHVSWWKKIIGLVVFAVAFYYSGPLATTLLGPDVSAIAIFGFQIAAAGFVLSLTSMAMSAWGDYGGAQAVGRFANVVNKMAAFMNVLQVVQNIIISVKAFITETVKKSFLKTVMDKVESYLTNIIKKYTVNITTKSAFSLVNSITHLVESLKLKSLKAQLSAKESILEKYKKEADAMDADEQLRSKDIALQFIKIYTDNLKKDQSIYDIDYLYEPTVNPGESDTLTTGNICRRSFI